MRPDEEANRSEIERDRETRRSISKGVGTAVALGTGLGTAAVSARVLPFLSTFIPKDLAMKGLSKVAPKVADFLKRGQSMGLNVEEGIQFIRDSIKPKEGKQPDKAKDNRNIIEQYSPELHQFIAQQVNSGRPPIEAAAIAQNDKRFSEVIKKLSKDHKTPWSSIIDSVYGTGQYGGAVNPPSEKEAALKKFNERKKGFVEEETERFQKGYGNQAGQQGRQPFQGPGPNPIPGAQQQGQPGPGQQALMDILSKINQKLGQ